MIARFEVECKQIFFKMTLFAFVDTAQEDDIITKAETSGHMEIELTRNTRKLK